MKIRHALIALLGVTCILFSIQPAMAANAKPITKDVAEKIVWQLPEVKAWAQSVERQSNGTTHGASKIDDDMPETIAGKQFWAVTCFVDFSDHIHRWHTFMISLDGKEILADSANSGDYSSLDKWRISEKPMQELDKAND